VKGGLPVPYKEGENKMGLVRRTQRRRASFSLGWSIQGVLSIPARRYELLLRD